MQTSNKNKSSKTSKSLLKKNIWENSLPKKLKISDSIILEFNPNTEINKESTHLSKEISFCRFQVAGELHFSINCYLLSSNEGIVSNSLENNFFPECMNILFGKAITQIEASTTQFLALSPPIFSKNTTLAKSETLDFIYDLDFNADKFQVRLNIQPLHFNRKEGFLC